jgi:hypothetical protein
MIIKNYIKEKEINPKEITLKIPIIYEIMKKYINEEILKKRI